MFKDDLGNIKKLYEESLQKGTELNTASLARGALEDGIQFSKNINLMTPLKKQ